MKVNEVSNALVEIASDVYGVDLRNKTSSLSIQKLLKDDVCFAEFTMVVEQLFGIEIPDYAVEDFRDIKDIARYIIDYEK